MRQAKAAGAVFIGEAQCDKAAVARAEESLRAFLPSVAVVSDASGGRFIPIQEAGKMEKFVCEEREKAYRRGLTEGHQRGLQEGLGQARRVAEQFDRAIKDAISQRESLLLEAREKVLDLIIEISRKVTFDAVRADPEAALSMIRAVIDGLIDRSRLKIRVHPDYLPVVEQNAQRFLSGDATIKEITFEPDPRVGYGGCLIETPTGDIDARLESQFDVITELMKAGEEGA